MADMHHLVQVDGVGAPAAFAALTTIDGITGWWTSRHRRPLRDMLSMRTTCSVS